MIISESKSDVIRESNHFQPVFEPQETVDQTMGTSLMNDNSKKLSTWDELLVRVGRDRDKSAFAELFDYFAPRVKSFLLRFGTDMSLAEEIAQEAMIMVWRRAETYDPRQSAASTWIFTIARNKRIDRLRRENRPLPDMTDPAVMPESIETGEIQVARMQQEKKIRHALKNLPEEQAKMIFSAYYEEKSHREIAEESGVALGTVKSRIRLALNRLRAHIDEDEGITP
jgi:RNA polymerase sigma-70 factor (ECF subfamily)|tara:strand:- start:743 stop:1423 length:681 start_codon:yes stop_codon:yes gene_type:complete